MMSLQSIRNIMWESMELPFRILIVIFRLTSETRSIAFIEWEVVWTERRVYCFDFVDVRFKSRRVIRALTNQGGSEGFYFGVFCWFGT